MKKYKKTIIIAALSVFAIIGGLYLCGGGNKHDQRDDEKSFGETGIEKDCLQPNITILLDLSDRISPTKDVCQPSHKERDLAIVSHLVDYFKGNMNKSNAFKAKGKIRVLMYPWPDMHEISAIQTKLSVDLSAMQPNEKKKVYDSISYNFNICLEQVYDKTIEHKDWHGSDIFRFFKNEIETYCFENESKYRNILVILTDGYIYDRTTTLSDGNRHQSLTISKFGKYLTSSNVIAAMEKDDFGLICPRTDLNDVEILLLEMTPSQNNQKHEDIMRYALEKWFREMGSNHYKVYKTDLPANTFKRIDDFLKK